jgi:DNA-binding transcriptional ArsR family regulator
MSIEALKWSLDIGEEREIEPSQRLVLIMLGNSADHAGGNLYPSYAFISRRTGLGKSTVRSHITALQAAGLLIKESRSRGDGSQTSNCYRLAMTQLGLALDPVLNSGMGVPDSSTRGARPRAGGVPTAGTHEPQEEKGEEVKAVAGRAAPTPVAACFQAYRDGIKKRYGADYPPSRRANGMLSHVVDRLGAAPALKVVDFYLAHGKPYYVQRKHGLEILVQDCTELWLELQATAGAGATATTASAFFELGDGRMKLMNDYPVAEPLDVARACAREYASRIEPWSVRNIVVRIGGRQSKFTPQEVR